MEYGITDEKIQLLVQKIVAGFDPLKVILFGSRAWGNPSQDSDVDLLIIKDTDISRGDRIRNVHKLIRDIEVPVDVLVYTPSEVARRLSLRDFFVEDIINKGKVLFSI